MTMLIDEFDSDQDLTPASDHTPSTGSWLEVRCEFPLRGRPAQPFICWPRLAEAFKSWRRADYYRLAFFVRKPPGLRLRFEVKHSAIEFPEIVTGWLNELVRAGALRKHVISVYEPEEYRFGGAEGLAVAHRLWSVDTELVLQYELLSPGQRSSMTRSALWAIRQQQLFSLTLEDQAEIWDVWCRLADVCKVLPGLEVTSEIYNRMGPTLIEPTTDLLPSLTPQMRLIMSASEKASAESANALRRLRDEGKLTRGLRSWLTANALFHANRWALGLECTELRAVTEAMVQLLEPDRIC